MIKHISLGENCLTQNFLKRHSLSSDSGVFSFISSNIELINLILEDDFENFLNPDYCKYVMFGSRKSIVNEYYNNETNRLSPFLYFSNHNILGRKDHRDSFLRKINRFREDIKNGNNVFWYNRRHIENDDIDLILYFFKEFDNKVGGDNRYVIFNQKTDRENKGFDHLKNDKFNIIECFDEKVWQGADNYDGKTFYEQFDLLINDYQLLKKID